MLEIAPYSDLHLEASRIRLDTAGADVVVLAGDIWAAGPAYLSRFDNVIDWAGETFPDVPVVFVPGNHDFEDTVMAKQMATWRAISALRYQGRIHVLWNNKVDIQGVRFLGTPLFTDFEITGHPEESMEWASRLGDFHRIRVSEKVLVTPADYAQWHRQARVWLDKELSRDKNVPKVVVTHFGPLSEASSSDRMNDQNRSYWVSDCSDLIARSTLWISGHTHYSHCITVGDVPDQGRWMSNARGYSKIYNLSADSRFSTSARVTVTPPNPTLKARSMPR